jgi:tetratricopeptide (TPR) repeat protein
MRIIILLISLLSFAPANALDQDSYRYMMDLYLQAVDGNEDARDEVKAYLEQVSKDEPDDAITRVYLGSVMTLEGRDAWMPWNKMKLTERGMDIMEQALLMSERTQQILPYLENSVEAEVMMLCAITFTQVPKMFGRFEQGLELFDAIVMEGHYQTFSKQQKGRFLYYRAEAVLKNDRTEDARSYLQKVINMNLQGEITNMAQEALGRL